jgi:hypothetical protein
MTCFSLQPQFFAGCDGSAKYGNQAKLRLLQEVTVIYVKFHQDDKRPVATLPLMAQLNVEAGAKATQDQQQFGSLSKHKHPPVYCVSHGQV